MKMSYVAKLSLWFGLTWGLVGLDRLMVGYAAPGFMPALKLNFTQLGLIVSVNAIGVAIAAWIIGPLSEFYGRRIGAVWGNLAEQIFSAVTGLAQTFGQMVGVRGFMGASMGSLYGPAFAAIAEESPPEKRGFYMGFTQSFFALIGMAIGPIVAGYLLTSVGWRYAFFLIAIPGIIVVLYLATFMREPNSVKENIRIRRETGRRVLQHEGQEFRIWDVVKYRNIILMTLISIFMMAYLFVLFTFVPTFFEKVHGLSPVTTGWVMSFGGFLCFIGQVFLPYLSDRIGRKPSLIILFLIGILGGVLFITAPPNASVGLLTVYFGIFGVGLSSYPLYLVIVPSESVPFTIAATAVALPQGLGEIVGATIFPAIGGHIADLYGLTYTLYMVVIACAVSLILALFMKETAPRFIVTEGKELSA